MSHRMDAIARLVFDTARREGREGELLEALFEGGSATVDRSGKLIIMSKELLMEMMPNDDGVSPCSVAMGGRVASDACEACGHALLVHRLTDKVCSVCEAVANFTPGESRIVCG